MGNLADNGSCDNLLTNGLRDCTVRDFETIFRTYYRELYLFAYGYVMDEMEADDIVQNVFWGIWEIRGRLTERLNIKAYLYTSVKHACLRYFQHLKITDEYKKRHAEALILSFASDDEETDDDVVKAVHKAMKELSEQQIRIVEMHVLNGLKYHEIAAQLGLSENTIRTHLKRAYKILRMNLSNLPLTLPLFVI